MKIATMLLTLPGLLVAMPNAPTVMSGKVEMVQSEKTLRVAAGDRSIINWESFSLSQDEQALFALPSAQAAILNRVTGGDPSRIFGKIKCNGKFVLINPSGILFGKTAEIDTSALLASSIDILDQHFLASEDLFSEDLARFAINLDGLMDVESCVQVGGAIRAMDVEIVGGNVNLLPDLVIDLTDFGDGGRCHVMGVNEVTMAPSAHVDASSLRAGNGGEVILVSSGSMLFQGDIVAEGGALSGNGGFVEVSGNQLMFQGTVSTLAPQGRQGTLLLDPVDITISSSATANVSSTLPNPVIYTPDNGSACATLLGSSILLDADLVAALNANDVVIDTVGSVGACPGDIIFDTTANVSYSSSNSFTLSAAGAVRFFSSVVNASNGPISITQAGGDVNVVADLLPVSVETSGGAISINNVAGGLNILGGNAVGAHARILASSATLDVNVDGDIQLIGGSVSNTAATLRNSQAAMTIQCADIFIDGGSSGADIFSGSGGDITATCASLSVNAPATSSFAVMSADNDLNLTVTAGDVTITAAAGTFAVVNASFEINMTVANSVTVSTTPTGYGAIFGDRESATIEAINGSIVLNGPSQVYAGNTAGASVFLSAGIDIRLNDDSRIDLFNPAGEITIVVDSLFPSPPGFGPGQFVLAPAASINAATMTTTPLQIFTADPAQNTITGSLNGVSFSPGPPLTDTDQERYGIYYPNSFFVSDYVVFYKTPINSPQPPNIPALIQVELGDFFEMFRLLHPYSEYLYGALQFSEKYESPEMLFGVSYQDADLFYLRKKSSTRGSFSIEYDSAKF